MQSKLRTRVTQVGVVAVGAVLGVSLGWLALAGTDWGQVQEALRNFDLLLLLAASLLLLASYYLRALRWRVLWTTERVSTLRLLVVENASLGLNNLSPVRALDEPVQFGILALRDRLPAGSVIATMLVSRILDILFTIIFIAVAVWALPSVRQFSPAIGGIAIYLTFMLVLLLNMERIFARFPVLRRIPGVTSLEGAMESIKKEKLRVGISFALTNAYWLLLGPIALLIARGVGIEMSFYEILVVVIGSIFFATAVPGLPAAIGTFQFAVIRLLGLFGAENESAVSFSIILHTLLFVPPMIFSVVVLPREGVGSIGDLRRFIGWVQETRGSREASSVAGGGEDAVPGDSRNIGEASEESRQAE